MISRILIIYTENLEMEFQMVRAIPFGKLKKLWAAGWGDTYFSLFLVFTADLAILRNFSFPRKVKLKHLCILLFVHEVFDRMDWFV